MKQPLVLILCFFALTSCRKESTAPEGLENKVNGRWNIVHVITTVGHGENLEVNVIPGMPDDYMNFNEQRNLVTKSLNGEMEEGSYKSVNDVALKIHYFGKEEADVLSC